MQSYPPYNSAPPQPNYLQMYPQGAAPQVDPRQHQMHPQYQTYGGNMPPPSNPYSYSQSHQHAGMDVQAGYAMHQPYQQSYHSSPQPQQHVMHAQGGYVQQQPYHAQYAVPQPQQAPMYQTYAPQQPPQPVYASSPQPQPQYYVQAPPAHYSQAPPPPPQQPHYITSVPPQQGYMPVHPPMQPQYAAPPPAWGYQTQQYPQPVQQGQDSTVVLYPAGTYHDMTQHKKKKVKEIRPMTSFLLYRTEKQNEVIKKLKEEGAPNVKLPVVSKIISQMWHKEPEAVKLQYRQRSAKIRSDSFKLEQEEELARGQMYGAPRNSYGAVPRMGDGIYHSVAGAGPYAGSTYDAIDRYSSADFGYSDDPFADDGVYHDGDQHSSVDFDYSTADDLKDLKEKGADLASAARASSSSSASARATDPATATNVIAKEADSVAAAHFDKAPKAALTGTSAASGESTANSTSAIAAVKDNVSTPIIDPVAAAQLAFATAASESKSKDKCSLPVTTESTNIKADGFMLDGVKAGQADDVCIIDDESMNFGMDEGFLGDMVNFGDCDSAALLDSSIFGGFDLLDAHNGNSIVVQDPIHLPVKDVSVVEEAKNATVTDAQKQDDEMEDFDEEIEKAEREADISADHVWKKDSDFKVSSPAPSSRPTSASASVIGSPQFAPPSPQMSVGATLSLKSPLVAKQVSNHEDASVRPQSPWSVAESAVSRADAAAKSSSVPTSSPFSPAIVTPEMVPASAQSMELQTEASLLSPCNEAPALVKGRTPDKPLPSFGVVTSEIVHSGLNMEMATTDTGEVPSQTLGSLTDALSTNCQQVVELEVRPETHVTDTAMSLNSGVSKRQEDGKSDDMEGVERDISINVDAKGMSKEKEKYQDPAVDGVVAAACERLNSGIIELHDDTHAEKRQEAQPALEGLVAAAAEVNMPSSVTGSADADDIGDSSPRKKRKIAAEADDSLALSPTVPGLEFDNESPRRNSTGETAADVPPNQKSVDTVASAPTRFVRPKRALTAFNVFQTEVIKKMKEEDPDVTGVNLNKRAGQLWKLVDAATKLKYKEKAGLLWLGMETALAPAAAAPPSVEIVTRGVSRRSGKVAENESQGQAADVSPDININADATKAIDAQALRSPKKASAAVKDFSTMGDFLARRPVAVTLDPSDITLESLVALRHEHRCRLEPSTDQAITLGSPKDTRSDNPPIPTRIGRGKKRKTNFDVTVAPTEGRDRIQHNSEPTRGVVATASAPAPTILTLPNQMLTFGGVIPSTLKADRYPSIEVFVIERDRVTGALKMPFGAIDVPRLDVVLDEVMKAQIKARNALPFPTV